MYATFFKNIRLAIEEVTFHVRNWTSNFRNLFIGSYYYVYSLNYDIKLIKLAYFMYSGQITTVKLTISNIRQLNFWKFTLHAFVKFKKNVGIYHTFLFSTPKCMLSFSKTPYFRIFTLLYLQVVRNCDISLYLRLHYTIFIVT